MTRPGNAPSYEEDFVAWLEDQARHEAAQLERFWRKRAHPLAAERKAIEQRLRLDLREVENGEPRAEQSQRSCGRQSGI